MGYTVDTRVEILAGRTYYMIEVTETDAAAASEWQITVPSIGEILLYQATLVSGSGTTIQPRVGKSSGWSDDTQDHVGGQDTAAAAIHDATPLPYALAGATMYGRSTVDAGADNEVTTLLVIREGV